MQSESDSNPGTPMAMVEHSVFQQQESSASSMYGHSRFDRGSPGWQNDQIHYICENYQRLSVQLSTTTAFDNRWSARMASDLRQFSTTAHSQAASIAKFDQFQAVTNATLKQGDVNFSKHLADYKDYKSQVQAVLDHQNHRWTDFDAYRARLDHQNEVNDGR